MASVAGCFNPRARAGRDSENFSVPVTYTLAQTAGNTNIVVVSWWNSTTTANLTSLVDSKGST